MIPVTMNREDQFHSQIICNQQYCLTREKFDAIFQKYQYNENDTLYCSAIPKPKSNFQINKVESPLSHKIFFLEQKPFISFFAFLDNSLYRRA